MLHSLKVPFSISLNLLLSQLNEQTNRLTEINERLRLYNGKLQDRLAKAVEHKVQAEATLASVKIAKEDERNETKEVQDGQKVEAQSLYWETGVGGRKEGKEEEVFAGSTMQVVGEVGTASQVSVGSQAPTHGDLHASTDEHAASEVKSGSLSVGSNVSPQGEMHAGSEVQAGNEVHAGNKVHAASEVHARSELHADSKENEIKGVENKKSGGKGIQKTPSIAQEAEEDDFVIVPRSSTTVSKADKRSGSGNRGTTKKGVKEAADDKNDNKPNDSENNADKHTEGKGNSKATEGQGEPDAKETPKPKKDPNRPRYTLAEMQQVLEERNRFKERVNILEDVLAAYVPRYVQYLSQFFVQNLI